MKNTYFNNVNTQVHFVHVIMKKYICLLNLAFYVDLHFAKVVYIIQGTEIICNVLNNSL